MIHAFYVPGFDCQAPCLTQEEGFHACRVLRIGLKESLVVLDGCGGRYLCHLKGGKAEGYPLVVERAEVVAPLGVAVHLFVAPPKQSPRLVFLVEKLSELGVSSLHFVNTKRSERQRIVFRRLHHGAIAAMKQSQGGYLLKIEEQMLSFAEALSQLKAYDHAFVANKEGNQVQSLWKEKNQKKEDKVIPVSCSLLVGPAGGLSEEERTKAFEAQVQPLCLSSQVLRTETAALVGAYGLLSCLGGQSR